MVLNFSEKYEHMCKMHTVTSVNFKNYLLVNLAVGDLMTILMIWPWMICTTNGFVKDIIVGCQSSVT